MRFLRPITALGAAALDAVAFLGGSTLLARDAARAVPRGLLARRGRRQGWRNLWAQMVRVGVRAVPIVSLVVFCIGAILNLQMTPVLENYGAAARSADIIAVAIFRELGPLVAAIVLTGFAGASIAAELGSMVVGEEIEALEAHAISPVRFLVMPRVIATTVMMVCLAIVADVVGVVGGGIVGVTVTGLNGGEYFDSTVAAVVLKDFYTGLIKAAVFGLVISILSCHLGLKVQGGATGVGNATTRTVVLTIVTLIFIDLLFTAVFYALKL